MVKNSFERAKCVLDNSPLKYIPRCWKRSRDHVRNRVKMRSFQNLPASFYCTNVMVAHSALAHKLSRAPNDMMQGSRSTY